jgi:hypothetical protein
MSDIDAVCRVVQTDGQASYNPTCTVQDWAAHINPPNIA